MRITISILLFLTLSQSSCAQHYKTFRFHEIGLNINIPSNYIIQDSFPKLTFLDTNNNPITDPAKLNVLEADLMKAILIVSTADQNNTASFNFAKLSDKTGNFEQYYDFSKNMQLLMAKQQMPTYDSVSSVLTVGKAKFYKYIVFSNKTTPNHYSGFYLAKLNTYFLIIKADYTDKQFGEAIEGAILSSTFE